MKMKTARKNDAAEKEAFEAYLTYMERECHVKSDIGACPDCRQAYEHAVRYYREKWGY